MLDAALKRRSSTVLHASVLRLAERSEVAPFPFVVASADSRFLTGLSARFGMTIFEASGGAAFEAAPFQSHI